jgi:hypothetical protein
VWQNTKESFAQVNKDGNLQNGIGIQVGQIQVIEIKASSGKRCENAGEARTLFIEEEGNRSPPTTATK